MDSQKLVPEGVAIFISILIPCSFVIFVDFTKKLAASNQITNRNFFYFLYSRSSIILNISFFFNKVNKDYY